jgi:hypothetical protein
METTLHRELKRLYAAHPDEIEVKLGRYRIDVARPNELVEVQLGSLAAIRDKVQALVASHDVRVVKPVVMRKQLVKRKRRGGPIVDRRQSPRRGRLIDFFDELVYFTRAFPHPRLTVDLVLVDVEEHRVTLRRPKRWGRRRGFRVEDLRLVDVHAVRSLRTAADLHGLLGDALPISFDTAELAAAIDAPRWVAQRVAYCLRKTGAAQVVGKRRNAAIYELIPAAAPTKRRRAA